LTFDDVASAKSQRIACIVQIEAVGNGYYTAGELTELEDDARTRFVSHLPGYVTGLSATARGAYKDYLAEIPRILEEENDELGGFSSASAIQVQIVDVGNYLTDLLRIEASATTSLAEDISATETEFDVEDGTDISATDVVFIGNEAMLVRGKATDTLTVTRGYMGTDAKTHTTGAPTHLYIPYADNRELEIKLVDVNAADETEAKSVGHWAIDALEWSTDLNVWILEAKSRLKYWHRDAPPTPNRFATVLETINQANTYVRANSGTGSIYLYGWTVWSGTEADADDAFYLRVGSEVMTVGEANIERFRINRREVVGTARHEPKDGDIAKQVFVAETEGPCSFRKSPGGTPSTSRASGTWDKTAHWLDLIMIVATSSPDTDDDTFITSNYNSTYGNFASLPAGYGVGTPHTLIDWAEYQEVKVRTLDHLFTAFVYGDETMPFAELIDFHFLKPIGAYFTVEGGQARIVLPRIPSLGRSGITIGPANVLTREVGPGVFEPEQKVRIRLNNKAGSLQYRVGPRSEPLNFNAGSPYDQRTYYKREGKSVTLDVPGVRPTGAAFLQGCMHRRLFRTHRPGFEVEVNVDLSAHDSVPGDAWIVTQAELPALDTGTRGWTSIRTSLLKRAVRHEVGRGWYIAAVTKGYGPTIKVGRVGPSAHVASFASDTATVTENRYTQSDAPSSLPSTDASAFQVGDICYLLDTDLTPFGGGPDFQEILSITSNDIEFDGDFGGNLAADTIIVHAGYDDSIEDIKTKYAFYSDATDRDPGASGDTPYMYGEP